MDELFKGLREVATNSAFGIFIRPAPQDHERERLICMMKKVYQVTLMDPIDLAEYSFDAIAPDGGGNAPRSEADLDGHVGAGLCARHDPVKDADGPEAYGLNVLAGALEEGADQPLPFQLEAAG